MIQRLKNAVSQTVSFVRKHTEKVVLAATAAVGSVLAASVPSYAVGDIDDMFLALNIAGLSLNVKTLLIAGVGLTLLFLGYRKLNKAANIF